MAGAGYTDHVIAAANWMMGATNLAIIRLPAGWGLKSGRSQPEVDYRTFYRNVAWATAGQVHYHLLRPRPEVPGRYDLAGELEIAIQPNSPGPLARLGMGRRPPAGPAAGLAVVLAEGEVAWGGHLARYARGVAVVGLPGARRCQPCLRMQVECPETGRFLSLSFLLTDPAAIDLLVAGAGAWRCH